MKTIEEILEFVQDNDFAFVYGAGKMFANDEDTRMWILDVINNSSNIQMVEDVEDEGCGCVELSDEEGVVYKFYNNNEEPLYIAVYNN